MSNSSEIMGRLVADPVVRRFDDGRANVTIRVADNRRWNNSDGTQGESVMYHQCQSWDPGFVKNLASLTKGTAVIVSGHFEPNTYETEEPVDADKPDGPKVRVRVYGQRLRIRTCGPDLRFQSAVLTRNERDDQPVTEDTLAAALAALTPEQIAALTAQAEAPAPAEAAVVAVTASEEPF